MGARVVKSTPAMQLIVLMRATPCAPPSNAAAAQAAMSPTLGVSLTQTGARPAAASTTHRVARSSAAGLDPSADPMPRSGMPWGQPALISAEEGRERGRDGRVAARARARALPPARLLTQRVHARLQHPFDQLRPRRFTRLLHDGRHEAAGRVAVFQGAEVGQHGVEGAV